MRAIRRGLLHGVKWLLILASCLKTRGYKLFLGGRMKLVTVKMPDLYVRAIDELVKEERYSSRSEVIRTAVRELLKRELWGVSLEEAPVAQEEVADVGI